MSSNSAIPPPDPSAPLRAFVSSTTQDMASCREEVRRALAKAEIFTVVQEDFPPDWRDVAEILRRKIESCDVVICLIGHAFGSAPRQQPERRSYTQQEYDAARKLGKPVYLFVTRDDFAPDSPIDCSPEDALLQREHRAKITGGEQRYEWFTSRPELRLKVAELIPGLLQHRKGAALPTQGIQLPQSPLVFVGRALELQELEEALRRPIPCVVAVSGIGGQGKTTLVSQWLRHQDRRMFNAAFWCTCTRSVTFDLFLDEVLAYLGKGAYDKRSMPDVASRSRELLKQMQQRPALVVLDGLEAWLAAPEQSLGAGHQECEGLDAFLRQCTSLANGSHLVITTRVLPESLGEALVAVIPVSEPGVMSALDGLDTHAAVDLLERLGVRGARAEMERIASEYGNHPLALTVVGRLLCKRYHGRIEMLPRVSALDPQQRLFELFEETRRHLPRGSASERLLGVAALDVGNPPLGALLAALSPRNRGWWPRDSLFRSRSASSDDLREHLLLLADWHLIAFDAASDSVRMHPLLRQYFAGLVKDHASVHRAYAEWYEVHPVPDDARRLDDVRPRVLAIEHWLLAGGIERAAELFLGRLTETYTFAEWLAANGHLSRDLVTRLAAASKSQLRAEFLSVDAALARQLGALEDAVASLDEAVSLLQASASGDQTDRDVPLAGILMNRGNCLRQLCRYAQSLADYDRSIGMLEHGIREPAVALATAYMNRGGLFHDMGRLTPALADCCKAVAAYEHVARSTTAHALPPALAAAHCARGNVLSDLRRFSSALDDFDTAFSLYERLVDEGRTEFVPRAAHVQAMRATALSDAGRGSEAMRDLDRAIERLKQLATGERPELEPSLALCLLNRARVGCALEQWEGAAADADAAVALYRRHVAEGRKDLRGYLAHAVLMAALASLGEGGVEAVEPLVSEGRVLADDLIQSGQSDLRATLVRAFSLIARKCIHQNPMTAYDLVVAFLKVTEAGLVEDPENEGLRLEARDALARADVFLPGLRGGRVDVGLLERVRSVV